MCQVIMAISVSQCHIIWQVIVKIENFKLSRLYPLCPIVEYVNASLLHSYSSRIFYFSAAHAFIEREKLWQCGVDFIVVWEILAYPLSIVVYFYEWHWMRLTITTQCFPIRCAYLFLLVYIFMNKNMCYYFIYVQFDYYLYMYISRHVSHGHLNCFSLFDSMLFVPEWEKVSLEILISSILSHYYGWYNIAYLFNRLTAFCRCLIPNLITANY